MSTVREKILGERLIKRFMVNHNACLVGYRQMADWLGLPLDYNTLGERRLSLMTLAVKLSKLDIFTTFEEWYHDEENPFDDEKEWKLFLHIGWVVSRIFPVQGRGHLCTEYVQDLMVRIKSDEVLYAEFCRLGGRM